MPGKTRPRILSATSTSLLSPFSLRSQIDFDATKSLLRSRSDCFMESKRARDREREAKTRKESTVWDIRPPDFRLQLYQPKPAKRNARESMLPNYDEDDWRRKQRELRREKVKFERVPLPKILQRVDALGKKDFVTSFKIPDSHTAKLMFVRDGKFHPASYETPGPHMFRGDDFRPLVNPSTYGEPEFDTSYEHDPQGLKAKSNGLRVLCESYRDLQAQSPDGYHKQMITYRPPELNWDVTLLLSKGAYKKGRSVQSVLMHRIEKQLPWCPRREKIEPITRPDIHDHKTGDWIVVTGHSADESTRI